MFGSELQCYEHWCDTDVYRHTLYCGNKRSNDCHSLLWWTLDIGVTTYFFKFALNCSLRVPSTKFRTSGTGSVVQARPTLNPVPGSGGGCPRPNIGPRIPGAQSGRRSRVRNHKNCTSFVGPEIPFGPSRMWATFPGGCVYPGPKGQGWCHEVLSVCV